MIPKEFRLKKNQIEYVLKKGVSATTNLFTARYLKFDTTKEKSNPKFAIITSVKFSKKATERNMIRRRLYESIRLNTPKILPLYIVIIPKKRTLSVEYKEIDKEISNLFNKLTIINQ